MRNSISEIRLNAQKISQSICQKIGDQGSCVMGYTLNVDGKPFIPQPVQGSLTCGKIYDAVKDLLINFGISDERITINYGKMD